MATRRSRSSLLLPVLTVAASLGASLATAATAADTTGFGSTERPASPLVEQALDPVALASAFDASFEDVAAIPDPAPGERRSGAGQRTGEFQLLTSGGSVTVDARAIREAIASYRAALGDPDALLAEAMTGEFWHLADVRMEDPAAVGFGLGESDVARVSVPELQFERRTHRSDVTSMLYVDFRLRHVLPEDLLADDAPSDSDIIAALREMEQLSTLEIGSGLSLATTD